MLFHHNRVNSTGNTAFQSKVAEELIWWFLIQSTAVAATAAVVGIAGIVVAVAADIAVIVIPVGFAVIVILVFSWCRFALFFIDFIC